MHANCFKPQPLAAAVCSLLWLWALPERAKASEAEFDPAFLNVDDGASVDLRRFSQGSAGVPGVWENTLYVNDVFISSGDVAFISREDKSVYPCLTAETVKLIALNPQQLVAGFWETEGCFDLTAKIPSAQVSYDSNEQRLEVTIPQRYMLNNPRGSVDPGLWDRGIPALLLGYNLNGYRSEANHVSYQSLFAGLNAGANWQGWYLRHNGTWSQSDGQPGNYNSVNTWVQRDIPILKARMIAGESSTSGQLFPTLPFRGLQLASDERMLPQSLRGYAPEIRGIANSNARVTVRQNGQVLYETSVSPGEFVINDLYPTGYGGDLDVTVQESDGSERHFSVPYAAVAQLLRPGASRFSFTAGEVRSETLTSRPRLLEGTWQYGFNNIFTGYSGVQLNENYHAFQLGTAVGTPVGAFSFDVTQARALLDKRGQVQSGQSYQASYSQLFEQTASNVSLAAYRFSSDGYMDLMTAMQTREAASSEMAVGDIGRAKNRMSLTVGQGLPGSAGQLWFSGSLQNYWNKPESDKQYQLGYNVTFRDLAIGLSIGRSTSVQGMAQTDYLLSFSMPLGQRDRINRPTLRTDLTYDSTGRSAQQLTLSGSAGEESQLGYSVTSSRRNQGGNMQGSASASYRSSWSSLNGSFSSGRSSKSAAAGISGTLIGHAGGVALSPYSAETFALVEAQGASGASVSGYSGVKIDASGFAAVPYLNPYQLNEVSIDPLGMAKEVELTMTTQNVAPLSGAVVKLSYPTRQGQPLLLTASWRGEPVPFGADVVDENQPTVGSVGQGGQLYARVISPQGQLRVQWGSDAGQFCTIRYQSLRATTAVCQ
ncbi:fimbrial biogenesis outer membrane usher protein [Enterobacteriaceae bacterium 89]|nr:fimbrial biogenesis outer membrane usher protein [Enterobacteriaceae bacterium 89]